MIDLDELLAPIGDSVPQGVDLRNPSQHTILSDLRSIWRRARQLAERQEKEAATDGSSVQHQEKEAAPDWASVQHQAEAILARHSKDLEVAAFLAEAILYTEGFAGLANGGALIAGLVEGFGDSLYPAPRADEPGVSAEEARLEPLIQLAGTNGRLLPAVRRVVLFTLPDGKQFTFPDCQESRSWAALRPEMRKERLDAVNKLSAPRRAERLAAPGMQPWDAVQQAARAGCGDLLAEQRGDIRAALDAWRAAAAVHQSATPDRLFPGQPLITLLEDVLRTVTELAPDPPAAPDTSGPAATPSPVASWQDSSRLDSREEALRQLGEITAFFRRTEPHSPLAYTLEDAQRRARLSWPQWLAEVVPDRAQREAILARLGIRPDIGTG